MESLTKKRLGAIMIDAAISTTVSLGVEYLLRKKIKNEAVHNLVTPTAIMWGLEYAQLRRDGQTIGYKAMKLALENEDGTKPTDLQIAKRMLYRDTISTFDYLKDRHEFEGENGSALPHDRFAKTVVKEL
ncbi:RDD family protein [Lysinibacillus sp. 3P01SB]|uniref:RDD family protein n=1 Tax=Lysinibacillus sp. 3P01SB TaxID=3132284 RepID=UPI0039A45DB1